MFTPQQIDQISFSQAKKAKDGYSMEEVDAFLEPLTEDYVTLYKENALLKSKMRVLVGKLEEYRKNEAALKEAAANAQRTAEATIRDAEAKAAAMMANASAAAQQAQAAAQAQAAQAAVQAQQAAQASRSSESLIAAENARVAEARRAANAKIQEIQEQMRTCIQALERIKGAAAAAPAAPNAPVAPAYDSDAVANEISQNLEALVGTAPETAPKAAPQHPVHESTTSRFANLNLQFGRNYDPTSR